MGLWDSVIVVGIGVKVSVGVEVAITDVGEAIGAKVFAGLGVGLGGDPRCENTIKMNAEATTSAIVNAEPLINQGRPPDLPLPPFGIPAPWINTFKLCCVTFKPGLSLI